MCNHWALIHAFLCLFTSRNKCREGERRRNCYKLTASLWHFFTCSFAGTDYDDCVCIYTYARVNIVVNVAYDLFDGIYELRSLKTCHYFHIFCLLTDDDVVVASSSFDVRLFTENINTVSLLNHLDVKLQLKKYFKAKNLNFW